MDLYLDQQAIDTTTPMGKLVFQVAGAFAEFERTMIRQRVKADLKRAVAQGVKLGRPKIDSTTERKVRKQLAKGVGILRVAKSLGIGTGTVQRIANELGVVVRTFLADRNGESNTDHLCDQALASLGVREYYAATGDGTFRLRRLRP